MARPRDPRRETAKEIWLDSNGKELLKDIATELGVSDSQIRRWKSQDKWNQYLISNVTNGKSNVTNKGGAPPGNKNAVGNKGNSHASPPEGNKNALKTGEFENLYVKYLDDSEKAFLKSEVDSLAILQNEINLLRVRQARMLKRIADAENGLNESELNLLYELRGEKQMFERNKARISIDIPNLKITEKRERKTPKIDLILRIEDALTRVNNSLTKALKQLGEAKLFSNKISVMKAQEEKLKAETEELKGSNKGNEDANNWATLLIEAEKELGDSCDNQ